VYLIIFKNYGKTPAMYRGLQPKMRLFSNQSAGHDIH
jgi:hypothetical protein